MLGMLQELGPCLINEYGNGTVYNPYGWNKDTALIFVDQPAGVGFSYVDEGEPIPGDSFTSAADMRIFLQMFMNQVFPAHKEGPLVITGESYGGHYLPTLGAEIVRQNALHPNQPQVALKSLAIGNGYVSPLDTAYGYYETLCTTHPGVSSPVFNESRCDTISTNLPRCISVAKTCYDRPDPAICEAANRVCWEGVTSLYDGESYKGGRNRYDITAPCELDDLCYPQSSRIQEYLNTSAVFEALGVPSDVKEFHIISYQVNLAFEEAGDIGITMKPELEYLLANQIDVLIYQGNLDLACNTAGAKRWTANMPWKGQAAFTSEDLRPWSSGEGEEKKVAGRFKEVNVRMVEGDEKTTRFALVTVDRAGHMVPQDQPAVALDLLGRWLRGEKFELWGECRETDGPLVSHCQNVEMEESCEDRKR